MVGQDFDSDNSIEARIARLVDDAHAANTEPVQDLVMDKLMPLQFGGGAKRTAGSDAFFFACPVAGVSSFVHVRHDIEDPRESHGDRETQHNNQCDGFRHPFGGTKSGQEQRSTLGDTGTDNDVSDGRTNDFSSS